MIIVKSKIREKLKGKKKSHYQPGNHLFSADQCANMLSGTQGALIRVMRNSISADIKVMTHVDTPDI